MYIDTRERRSMPGVPQGNASVVFAMWTLAIGIVVLGLIDLWLGSQPGQVTISAYLLSLSRHYPMLPLAVGVLLGHIFWPQ